MMRNQAPVPASRAKKRAGGTLRDSEVRETIGCEAHRCANSSYAEGRFFAANNKLATLNAAKPGACSSKQGEETGRRDVARRRS